MQRFLNKNKLLIRDKMKHNLLRNVYMAGALVFAASASYTGWQSIQHLDNAIAYSATYATSKDISHRRGSRLKEKTKIHQEHRSMAYNALLTSIETLLAAGATYSALNYGRREGKENEHC